MSMVIEEPKQKETFTQRKQREQREVSSSRLLSTFFFCLTDRPCLRPKLVEEFPPKQNVQHTMPVAEMKPWQPAPWTLQTRGSR